MRKIEFHTHTYHSYDCRMRPEKILEVAVQKGADAIVINDHDTIKGGLECKKINTHAGLEVIVGSEVKTSVGDITGIFLKEEIRSFYYQDVISEIKKQGGIVILNHPFVGHKLDDMNFEGIDLVEGFNGRLTPGQNQLAVELAKKINKPIVSGSDAHTYAEVANCLTEIEGNDFLHPIKTHYIQCSKWAPVKSQFVKSLKRKDVGLFTRILLKSMKKVFTK